MKKITAKEFKRVVELDPAWAAKLTEPVMIVGSCDMSRSKISHLSPLLHFTETSLCASFADCKHLKVAEGTFHGFVDFSRSGVEDFRNIILKNRANVSFSECKNLKAATGSFDCYMNFNHSGLESIQGLRITRPNMAAMAADFRNCKNLKVAEGRFNGGIDFSESGIEKIGDLVVTNPTLQEIGTSTARPSHSRFLACPNLKTASGTFANRVKFESPNITHIGNLKIGEADEQGIKANFFGCPNLKSADDPQQWLAATGIIIGKAGREALQQDLQTKKTLRNNPQLEI